MHFLCVFINGFFGFWTALVPLVKVGKPVVFFFFLSLKAGGIVSLAPFFFGTRPRRIGRFKGWPALFFLLVERFIS